jgi:hypothetical protein
VKVGRVVDPPPLCVCLRLAPVAWTEKGDTMLDPRDKDDEWYDDEFAFDDELNDDDDDYLYEYSDRDDD